MESTSITSTIDGAQIAIWLFWLFFVGLILYLRREDKREGYPLQSDRSAFVTVQGFPTIPAPKTFRVPHGAPFSVPRLQSERVVAATPIAAWPGAPLDPTGDPLRDGVGPAAYAEREDAPEMTFDGRPLIVPMRVVADAYVAKGDPDPRGMIVYGLDNRAAGTVSDIWTDLSEPQIRYLEVTLAGTAAGTRLLPIAFAKIDRWEQRVRVANLPASQFVEVPTLRQPNVVTKLEEDKISAFYGGGDLYARQTRREQVL